MRQAHIGTWAQQTIEMPRSARLQAGVRGDLFRFSVHDRLERPDAERGGTRLAARVSPKASLALAAASGTSLFLNVGAGFHSNDARAVVDGQRTLSSLPAAIGAEIGARRSWRTGTASAALWTLGLGSELVYVGDEGTTEAGGRTRRVGIDLDAKVRLVPWLWADGEVSLSRGRFIDEPRGADRIPLAPAVVAAAGVTALAADGRFEANLRLRHIGPRPANETGTVEARGPNLLEAFSSFGMGRARVFAAAENLLDVDWNEAQFATTSRLRDEPSAVTELHFTPGARRTVTAGVEVSF